MKLIWRKTTDTLALMDWSGVMRRGELPPEYVNGKGPKFWLVPPGAMGGVRYIEYIQLGEDAGKALDANTFPNKLYIGTVLTYREQERVAEYLLAASRRLHDLNVEIADSEIVTTTL